jgi:hypothetical protein
MSGLVSALADCAQLLAGWNERAAIVGGVAFVARVRGRLTEDIDVAVVVPKGREPDFVRLCRSRGFQLGADDERDFLAAGLARMVAPSGTSVDFMVADDALFEAVVARATPVDLGGLSLPVATVEDLLLMKLDANRLLDLDDAIAIKDVHGAQLDRDYLETSARRLGFLERLEGLLGPRRSSEP